MKDKRISFWLRPAVLEYVSNNSGKVDSVDIAAHFKLGIDITLKEVTLLKEEGKIHRVWNGRKYVYKLVKPEVKA